MICVQRSECADVKQFLGRRYEHSGMVMDWTVYTAWQNVVLQLTLTVVPTVRPLFLCIIALRDGELDTEIKFRQVWNHVKFDSKI